MCYKPVEGLRGPSIGILRVEFWCSSNEPLDKAEIIQESLCKHDLVENPTLRRNSNAEVTPARKTRVDRPSRPGASRNISQRVDPFHFNSELAMYFVIKLISI